MPTTTTATVLLTAPAALPAAEQSRPVRLGSHRSSRRSDRAGEREHRNQHAAARVRRSVGAAGWRRTEWVGVATAIGLLTTGAGLAAVTRGGPVTALGGLLRADALTAFMLLVIGAVALIATWTAPAYLSGEVAAGHANERTATRYGVLVQAFLAAMCLAVLAGNLGVLWVAVEATTITTAFLVGHRATRAAVEAAWKYVVIC